MRRLCNTAAGSCARRVKCSRVRGLASQRSKSMGAAAACRFGGTAPKSARAGLAGASARARAGDGGDRGGDERRAGAGGVNGGAEGRRWVKENPTKESHESQTLVKN